MNSENSTKSLVNAALLSAITVAIYAAARFVPFLDIVLIFGAHLPLVVIFSKHGIKYAGFGAVVSAALIFILLGPLSAIRFLLTTGVVGIILGYYSTKKGSSITAIAVLSIATLLSMGILLKITTLISGVDIISQTTNDAIKSLELSINTLKDAGMSQAVGNINIEDFKTYLQISMPGMALITTGILSYLNYIITQKSLRRLKVGLEPIKEFSMWYIPSKIAYPVMILSLGSMFLGGEELTPIGYAIRVIFVMVFTINALSTVSYYLKRAKIPKPLIAVILIGVFLMLQSILLFVGLIEYALNIRGLDENRASILRKK